jgi:hypothetical protein
LPPAAAAVEPDVLAVLEEELDPESDEALVLDDELLELEDDGLLELEELPSFLVEL